MYLVAIFFTFVVALMGMGGLEMALSYQHGQISRVAARIATDYMNQAEQACISNEGTNFDPSNASASYSFQLTTCGSGTADHLCSNSTSATPPPGGVAINGAGGSNCNYYAKWTSTLGSASSTSSSGSETSSNVNTNAGEQRASATITIAVQNGAGITIARRVRTITLRSYALSPFVSVVNSSDTQDPFMNASGTVGTQGSLAEGDNAGCSATSAQETGGTSTCGTNTEIGSYAACQQATGATPPPASTLSMQQTWCSDQNASTTGNGYYSASATPAPSSQWLYTPAPTTNVTNQTWSGSSGSANSGN